MNERIKQLWEESQHWNGSDDGRGGLKILESVEKFAELIVQECMRMCEVAQVGYLTHGLEKEASGAYSVKQYIEEYLGVES